MAICSRTGSGLGRRGLGGSGSGNLRLRDRVARRLSGVRSGMVVAAIALLVLALSPQPALATGVYDMPVRVGSEDWIIDDANQIIRVTEGKLANKLRALAEQTGDVVRFVTIHRLDYGETPGSFADQLFERWFPDETAQQNQTVIVLDDVTNDAGIHVGSGTSERLPTEIAASIVAETMKVPLLQGNKYSQSLLDAADRMVAVLSGDPDPGPPVLETEINTDGTFATAAETEANRTNYTTIVVVLLVLATVIPMATYYWYQSMGG